MKDSYIDEVAKRIENMDNMSGGVQLEDKTVGRANFNIKVKRLTNNISQELPYAIFGASFLASGYSGIIDVPTGMTMTVTTGFQAGVAADYKKVKLTFTSGADVDIIEITSQAASAYPSLLSAMASDSFITNRLRLDLSDATQVSQFQTELSVKSKTIFGKSDDNEVALNSQKSPNQFATGIIDVPMVTKISKDSALVGNIIAVANFTLSFNINVSQIIRG